MTALLVLLAAPCFADDPPEAAVRALLVAQQDAWNKGDLEGFMAGYWNAPGLTFYSGRDKQQGWQATMARYKARYQSPGKEMGRLTFSELEVDVLAPDCVLARGRWKVELKDQTLDGLFSVVVRKKPEGWRIVHDHTSAGEPMKK
jgi:ketosteroid isomerase-like protein